MTFESEGLLILAIYICLPPASYVVFLTTLVFTSTRPSMMRVIYCHPVGFGVDIHVHSALHRFV